MSSLRKFLGTPAQEEHADQEATVFLAGTVNGSAWREALIPQLTVPFFNPVVEDWTAEDKRREEQARAICKVVVYVITPKMKGFFSIAELVRDVMDERKFVVYYFMKEDGGETFDEHQLNSVVAIENLLADYSHGYVSRDLTEVAKWVNELGAPNAEPAP